MVCAFRVSCVWPLALRVVAHVRKFLILIGPEGDFDEEEIIKAGEAGFTAISLGEARLRTETAGVVACQNIAFMNE